MSLFVWNQIADRKVLSYIIRRKYEHPLEPAYLIGWLPGTIRKDMLFNQGDNDQVEGDLVHDLTPKDYAMLDLYHAIGDGIHRRLHGIAKVLRFGKMEEVEVQVYVYGPSFQLLKGRIQ